MDINRISCELEIRNLYASYTYAADDHDIDKFLDCFTPDAVIDASTMIFMQELEASGAAPYIHDGKISGHDNMRQFLGLFSADAVFHHLTGNIWIRNIDGDNAESQAVFTAFADDGLVEHYGRYFDKLKRCEDDRWRLSHRRYVARFQLEREGRLFNMEDFPV